jgi:hypothetical protein
MPTTTNIDHLRQQLTGTIAARGDAAYDDLRSCWNLTVDLQPELIIAAADEADVQAAARYAAEQNLPITVLATGHGQPRNCQGGIVIRTSALNHVEVDPASRTAKVGGGAVWGDVIAAAHPHGLAPLSGSSPNVGVVGYLLGGGYGLMLRTYGLGIDHVKAFRVVLSDGTAVTASAESHTDLFWALQGGGGSFGIVTEVTVGLVPHAEVYAGSMMFPADRASEVYAAYGRWTKTLPNDLTTGLIMISFPPVPFVPEFLQGRQMVILTACMAADPQRANELLQPMRDLGPEFDFMGVMPFTESARVYNDPVDPLPANGRGILLRDVDDEALAKLLEAIGPMAYSPNLMIQLRHLGGAMANRAESDSPIGDRRRATYVLYLLGVTMGPVTMEMMAGHAEGVFAALQPWTLSRGPLNWLGEGAVSAEEIRSVFGDADYERLCAVKRTYDVRNAFRCAGVGICDA